MAVLDFLNFLKELIQSINKYKVLMKEHSSVGIAVYQNVNLERIED
jgi:hypothetical protein